MKMQDDKWLAEVIGAVRRLRSKFGLLALCEEELETFLALDAFLAELVVGAEASGVGVEGVGAVLEHDLQGVDSLAVGVQVVA
jgi:hypothetical protein